MDRHTALITLTFVLYMAGMLLIGLVAYRRSRNLSDYLLGGRSLGRWVAALSAGASDMSGWLLLGLPGFAYAAGMQAAWIALGLLLGTYLNWLLVAARLRSYSQLASDALTLPEFFEFRFRDRTRALRIISALFILLFFLFYTSSGLVAGGKLFAAVFGMPYRWAVAAGAVAILAYTWLGGFLAVCWTDVIQGLLMALALIVVPLAAIHHLGGAQASLAILDAKNPALLNPFVAVDGHPLSAVAIASLLGWGLGYFGQPHILARFKAIHSPAAVPGARRIAVTWSLIGLSGALLAGLTGIAAVSPELHGADTEKVFIFLIQELLHPLPAGICLAAILAAIMSTADSQLLVASSALARDFYQALFRRDANPDELIRIGRLCVVAIALLAGLLALNPHSKVLDLVAYAWAGFGAAFGPTLLLALYWPRMTAGGALAGVVVGGTTVVTWRHLHGGIFDLYELVPGFVLSFAGIVMVSLLGRRPAAAITDEFAEARMLARSPR